MISWCRGGTRLGGRSTCASGERVRGLCQLVRGGEGGCAKARLITPASLQAEGAPRKSVGIPS